MPVRILSALSPAEKDQIIDRVFAEPHAFTIEDLEWAKEHFAYDEAKCRSIFREAPRLGGIFVDDTPAYLFAIPGNNIVNTASHRSLEDKPLSLTKDAIRFGGSVEGMAMLSGSFGYVEQSDIERGFVRTRWLEAIGYQRLGTVEAYGQTFIQLRFGE